MLICVMYYHLIEYPDKLKAHEDFFKDLFNAFFNILDVKVNKPEDFKEKYGEFEIYASDMIGYFYAHVAVPSDMYNQDFLNKMTNYLLRSVNQ